MEIIKRHHDFNTTEFLSWGPVEYKIKYNRVDTIRNIHPLDGLVGLFVRNRIKTDLKNNK